MPVEPDSLQALNATQQYARDVGVDLARLPGHVAVIMDGNGRWAQRRGLDRLLGHQEGYRTLRRILLCSSELGIQYLTAYAFSVENWRRPQGEVEGLLHLIERAAREELATLHRNNVRWLVMGRVDELPDGLRRALNDGVESTKDNTGITLVLAVNYGGRAEIVDAARRLVRDAVPEDQINEEALSARMYQPDVPDPDLLIRTGGEMRWSNYLIWQAAYAELVVCPESWPDFDEACLVRAIREFQGRHRKFGGL